ncbi:hypothetical protein ACJZ2D_002305 [Fusarium nematophilum]
MEFDVVSGRERRLKLTLDAFSDRCSSRTGACMLPLAVREESANKVVNPVLQIPAEKGEDGEQRKNEKRDADSRADHDELRKKSRRR